mmetsp:Transcript_127637/g.291728  ORF Transcript_127637/g.291728 Transcript_127637/m.291728 type:complete len:223 (-) Transcript_127637:363-1031(-)
MDVLEIIHKAGQLYPGAYSTAASELPAATKAKLIELCEKELAKESPRSAEDVVTAEAAAIAGSAGLSELVQQQPDPAAQCDAHGKQVCPVAIEKDCDCLEAEKKIGAFCHQVACLLAAVRFVLKKCLCPNGRVVCLLKMRGKPCHPVEDTSETGPFCHKEECCTRAKVLTDRKRKLLRRMRPAQKERRFVREMKETREVVRVALDAEDSATSLVDEAGSSGG